MITLSPKQQSCLDAIVRGVRQGKQIQTLGGYAGTGKTTLTSRLHQTLPGFAPCAFTGKAANTMRQKGIYDANTIHSTIYFPHENDDKTITWKLNPSKMIGYDGFLVDEASMVSGDEYDSLLSYGLPIIFVGDHGQLEPVGSDVNIMKDPEHRLEEIHRNAGEIAHFAEHIRKAHISPNTFAKVVRRRRSLEPARLN